MTLPDYTRGHGVVPFDQCELVFSSFTHTTRQEWFFSSSVGIVSIKPRFLWPELHAGLCVEPAFLWVTPCCHTAPTTLKSQHEGNDAVVVEGWKQGEWEDPCDQPRDTGFS